MGFLGSLEKMSIIAYKDKEFKQQFGPEYFVYINPEKYTHQFKICYNDVQAQGSPGASPDFNKIATEVVSFELVFDGTGVVPSPIPGVVPFTGDGITKQISDLKSLVFDYNGTIHSPNYIQLTWGTLLFKCRMSSLNITYTLFKPDGTPLRARAQAKFQGYNDERAVQLKAGKTSSDLTHIVTVKSGDTLPLLCYQIYGTSLYYLQVAAANGLADFRNLPAGMQLIFPPVQEPGT
jgi:phage tail protein X